MLPAPTRLSSIFADNNLPIIRTCVGPPRSNRAEFTYWPPRRFARPRSPAVRCFHDFAAAAEKSLYPLELAFALIGPIQTFECIPNRGFQFLTAIQVGPHARFDDEMPNRLLKRHRRPASPASRRHALPHPEHRSKFLGPSGSPILNFVALPHGPGDPGWVRNRWPASHVSARILVARAAISDGDAPTSGVIARRANSSAMSKMCAE